MSSKDIIGFGRLEDGNEYKLEDFPLFATVKRHEEEELTYI